MATHCCAGPASHPVSTSASQTAGQPASQPPNKQAGNPAIQPASHPASQQASLPASQPARPPSSQPASQPARVRAPDIELAHIDRCRKDVRRLPKVHLCISPCFVFSTLVVGRCSSLLLTVSYEHFNVGPPARPVGVTLVRLMAHPPARSELRLCIYEST